MNYFITPEELKEKILISELTSIIKLINDALQYHLEELRTTWFSDEKLTLFLTKLSSDVILQCMGKNDNVKEFQSKISLKEAVEKSGWDVTILLNHPHHTGNTDYHLIKFKPKDISQGIRLAMDLADARLSDFGSDLRKAEALKAEDQPSDQKEQRMRLDEEFTRQKNIRKNTEELATESLISWIVSNAPRFLK